MTPREDYYSNTEADAGRVARWLDDTPGRYIGTEWVDENDIPSLSDLAD